jgi:hypothetical protein
MPEKQKTPGHHASAAYHHLQAAYYHREASKHYQDGKDYAHAAHMALAAYGHALKAIWHENEAHEVHETYRAFSPEPLESYSGRTDEIGGPAETVFSSAAHHAAAANDHEQAAQHQNLAAEYFNGNDQEKAEYEANIAHGYARRAIFHGDEAAKHHVEHYGKSGPTAEIL